MLKLIYIRMYVDVLYMYDQQISWPFLLTYTKTGRTYFSVYSSCIFHTFLPNFFYLIYTISTQNAHYWASDGCISCEASERLSTTSLVFSIISFFHSTTSRITTFSVALMYFSMYSQSGI